MMLVAIVSVIQLQPLFFCSNIGMANGNNNGNNNGPAVTRG